MKIQQLEARVALWIESAPGAPSALSAWGACSAGSSRTYPRRSYHPGHDAGHPGSYTCQNTGTPEDTPGGFPLHPRVIIM